MPSNRILIHQNSYVYHIFNRGIERRKIFLCRQDYKRAIKTIEYYAIPISDLKFSEYENLSIERKKQQIVQNSSLNSCVKILAYCLMPNHFHFLLRQEIEGGIQSFMMKIANSYAKYFNTKYDRVGPLFQNRFKSVHIESDEQLVHVSRYIHLNPVVAGLIKEENMAQYEWSSISNYNNPDDVLFVETKPVLSHFSSRFSYLQFIKDQISYAKEIGKIKQLQLD